MSSSVVPPSSCALDCLSCPLEHVGSPAGPDGVEDSCATSSYSVVMSWTGEVAGHVVRMEKAPLAVQSRGIAIALGRHSTLMSGAFEELVAHRCSYAGHGQQKKMLRQASSTAAYDRTSGGTVAAALLWKSYPKLESRLVSQLDLQEATHSHLEAAFTLTSRVIRSTSASGAVGARLTVIRNVLLVGGLGLLLVNTVSGRVNRVLLLRLRCL